MNKEELREYQRVVERQWAGIDPHFKKPDGSGWFKCDPEQIQNDSKFKKGRLPITEIYDYSDAETSDGRRLPLGSFLMVIGDGSPFMISHPDDIKEFLERIGVSKPQELIGKEITLYWEGYHHEPVPGNKILGVDL